MSVSDEQEPRLPSPIVLYDGGCPLCDRTVRWLLQHDSRGELHYASLQGETAARLRSRFPAIPPGLDTVVLVELGPGYECIRVRSRAVFRIATYLDGPWRLLALARIFPAFLTDLGYRLVASYRHRFGRSLGPVAAPSESVRARFLD